MQCDLSHTSVPIHRTGKSRIFFPLIYYDHLKRNIAFLIFLYITFMLGMGRAWALVFYYLKLFRFLPHESGVFNKSWFTIISLLFRWRFVRECNYLNFISYSLLQSHETLQEKSNITLFAIKRWPRRDTRSYVTFVAKCPRYILTWK